MARSAGGEFNAASSAARSLMGVGYSVDHAGVASNLASYAHYDSNSKYAGPIMRIIDESNVSSTRSAGRSQFFVRIQVWYNYWVTPQLRWRLSVPYKRLEELRGSRGLDSDVNITTCGHCMVHAVVQFLE